MKSRLERPPYITYGVSREVNYGNVCHIFEIRMKTSLSSQYLFLSIHRLLYYLICVFLLIFSPEERKNAYALLCTRMYKERLPRRWWQQSVLLFISYQKDTTEKVNSCHLKRRGKVFWDKDVYKSLLQAFQGERPQEILDGQDILETGSCPFAVFVDSYFAKEA